MQFSNLFFTAVLATTSALAAPSLKVRQPFAATMDLWSRGGCVVTGSPDIAEGFILNPTTCNAILPGTISGTVTDIFPGCTIRLYEAANCGAGGVITVTVADPTPNGCKQLTTGIRSYSATCV
ncbi:hypothetical protein B0O99DRAFT_598092 [Bisporella sp. PMI_857]|nr:hypothetical protein B0O99DRAFT_598092 [Bisporella sp. PMI_857]